MDAKKCDRCGSFYVRKELKRDNVVDILGKKVFNITLKYRGCNCDCGLDVDLCPKCMNDLKTFMEVQHITPYIAKVEDTEGIINVYEN